MGGDSTARRTSEPPHARGGGSAGSSKGLGITIFRGAITLAVAVLGYLAKTQSSEIEQLECKIATFAVTNALQDMEAKLATIPVPELKSAAEYPPPLRAQLRSDYGKHLQKCDNGRTVTRRLEGYDSGLQKFVGKDYSSAASAFDGIDDKHSVTETLLGSSLLRRAREVSQDQANVLTQRGIHHLNEAKRKSEREFTSVEKDRVLIRVRCNSLIFNTQANDEGIKCLDDMVARGYGTYNVYYSYSALYARKRNFEKSLEFLTKAREQAGSDAITRHYVTSDPDFFVMKADTEYGSKFDAIANLFPP